MRVRLIAVFTAVMTVLAVLPAAARPPASTRQAPLATGGSPDGTPAGSQAFEGVGPALPGPDYVVAFDELTNPPRDRRLVADSEGHVLLGNTVEVNGDVIDRLVALDTADGNVAWTLDDIESTCLPTATDDGRIFATLVANSDTSGVNNFSSDPVEIDALLRFSHRFSRARVGRSDLVNLIRRRGARSDHISSPSISSRRSARR